MGALRRMTNGIHQKTHIANIRLDALRTYGVLMALHGDAGLRELERMGE
jgi:hypothetical protein